MLNPADCATVTPSQTMRASSDTSNFEIQGMKALESLFRELIQELRAAKKGPDLEDFLKTPVASVSPPSEAISSIDPDSASPTNGTNLANLNRPGLLNNGPVTFENVDLQMGADNRLTENSKAQVNELLSELTDQIGGNEVHGAVFENRDGGLNLQLTPGTRSSVRYRVPMDTVYSAHTHPGGTTYPSPMDLRNRLPGAEDALVVSGQGYTYG